MKRCPKCGVEYADATTLCPNDGVALEKTDDSLIGTVLAGKYRIDARLNEGGMGSVYQATHMLMEKTVAIKVLRPSLAADEKIVARFSREARAASRISHPNALSVTDFGEDENGIVFLVMEFLSGKTLKQVIREEGTLPLQRVVEITRQIGDALAAAHAQGVVHRDLKSDNIMLLDTTVGDHAKVLDFGIAKINEPDGKFDGDLTAPNLVIGTPQYMSPEQCAQDAEIDARSDIYSLGVILYEMLVGHVPFSGESATIVMMKHLQEPVPSVLEERPDVPPPVARVVARAMAKVPGNRYQNVADLIEDLTIASGMIVPVPVTASAERPAVSGVPVTDDPDEITVVRKRDDYVEPPARSGQRRAPVTVPIQPVAGTVGGSSFNPWKILIPAAVALLVVFAGIYALTMNSASTNSNVNTSQPASTLAADPNSQPVQPAQPPTGKAEEGLPSGGSVKPSANANASANASPNANAEGEPTPIEDVSPVANANENSNSNTNSNTNRSTPPLPEPTRSVVPANVPVPTPAATKPPAPAPTPSPN
ncbi:MAG TPA: serine/threonine-protein kinase [Pyrinomonadaceae bacterium]|nr:serine/threonine-protein kinase [Pyrinomonadaceae bacterium]